MEKMEKILEAINFAKDMVLFTNDAQSSIQKLFFNWSQIFGKEDDFDDPDYAFLFYCVDFFDEDLENVNESDLSPMSYEEKMDLFCKKGKQSVMETGQHILSRLEKLLEKS